MMTIISTRRKTSKSYILYFFLNKPHNRITNRQQNGINIWAAGFFNQFHSRKIALHMITNAVSFIGA